MGAHDWAAAAVTDEPAAMARRRDSSGAKTDSPSQAPHLSPGGRASATVACTSAGTDSSGQGLGCRLMVSAEVLQAISTS